MATEVKQQHIISMTPAAAPKLATYLSTSISLQPNKKLMVNANMTNDLVQLVPDGRDLRNKELCYNNSNNLATILAAPGPVTALKNNNNNNNNKCLSQVLSPTTKESEKNTTASTSRDERSAIDTPVLPPPPVNSSSSSLKKEKKKSPAEGSSNSNGTSSLAAIPKPPRRRRQSASLTGTNVRRTIFDSFWKISTSSEGDADSPSASANSGRSRSITIPNSPPVSLSSSSRKSPHENFSNSNSNRDAGVNIMRFSPPVQHQSVLRARFEELHPLPSELQQVLPPLPSPLSRIYRNDCSYSSGGMYPLTSPRSILHNSSFEPSLTLAEDHPKEEPHSSSLLQHGEFSKSGTGPSMPMIMSIPLSLTDSIRLNDNGQRPADANQAHNNSLLEDLLGETSDDTSSSVSTTNRRVQFDPRVTISEYDDRAPREWYADSDLDRFKFETIALAQRYLLHHPALAAEYCLGSVDPVTGCVRKKTLYSLPILNCVSDTGDDDDEGNSVPRIGSNASPRTAGPSYDYARIASTHVQRILIVDPNQLIVDLFCKSLRQIFPHAELTAVQTGEEALYHVKRQWSQSTPKMVPRAFDIVIIEERLHSVNTPRQTRTPQKINQRSVTGLVDYRKKTTSATGPGSDLFQPKFLSGSEVIVKLKELEDDFCRPDRCIPEEEDEFEDPEITSASASSGDVKDVCWRSLVVGVCVDPKHDTLRLWRNGADLVWGKPPPPMGENLRNQLVGLLVKKRNLSLINTRPNQQ